MGKSTEDLLSGFGCGEDSIGIEGAEGRKPLQERRLEPLGRRWRLRDIGTLIPSMGPDRGYFARRSALCSREKDGGLVKRAGRHRDTKVESEC
jgi:hypothetical protein